MKRAVVLVLSVAALAAVPTVALSATAAGGYSHTVVVKTSDGTVWAWGAFR